MSSGSILLTLGTGFLLLVVGFLVGLFVGQQRVSPTEQGDEGELADTRTSNEVQRNEVEQLSAKLESRRATITTLNSKLESLQAEGATLRAKLSDMENENAQIPQLRARLNELERVEAERAALAAQIAELEGAAQNGSQQRPNIGANLENRTRTAATPNLAEATTVLGRKIKLDDLTTIEGIGPKTADLLNAEGINTWRQLSQTHPSHLSQLLNNAGPQFRRHDPSSWPEQAGLLAQGRWAEYRELTDRVSRSRKA